jgi:hypothetical protein
VNAGAITVLLICGMARQAATAYKLGGRLFSQQPRPASPSNGLKNLKIGQIGQRLTS